MVLRKPKTADIFINASININKEDENEISGMESNVDFSINGGVVNNKNGAENDQMEPLSEPACSCKYCDYDCKNCTSEVKGGEEITTLLQDKDTWKFFGSFSSKSIEMFEVRLKRKLKLGHDTGFNKCVAHVTFTCSWSRDIILEAKNQKMATCAAGIKILVVCS